MVTESHGAEDSQGSCGDLHDAEQVLELGFVSRDRSSLPLVSCWRLKPHAPSLYRQPRQKGKWNPGVWRESFKHSNGVVLEIAQPRVLGDHMGLRISKNRTSEV